MLRNSGICIPNIVLKSMLKTKNNLLNLCHINACSLYPKIQYIRQVLSDCPLSLVCITETWFTPTHTNAMVKIPGYKLIRHDRNKSGKRGGGIGVYIRESLTVKIICKSKPSEHIEYICLEIIVSNIPHFIVCVYNPPKFKDFEIFRTVLDKYSLLYNNIIITGDFNVNALLRSPIVVGFEQMLGTFGLNIINTHPTHFMSSSHAPSCLDLFITNNNEKVCLIDQLDIPGISRHDMIVLSFATEIEPHAKPEKQCRAYNEINLNDLISEMYSLPWNDIFITPNMDDKLSLFNSFIVRLFDSHVPLKSWKTSPFILKSKPLEHACLDRDLAHKLWRRNGSLESWNLFVELRNNAKHIEKEELKKYYCSHFSQSNSSSDLWSKINNLGVKDDVCNVKMFSSESLNMHFLNNSDSTSDIQSASTLEDRHFSLTNVTEEVVHKAITSIKSKSTGNDGVSPKFLHIILPHILPVITHIFNSIITTSYFPACWKCARVIPLAKCNFPKSLSDYRPISILPFLSKAFERIVHNQISEYISLNNLLAENQSGFRPNRSTTTALLEISEEIRTSLDKGSMSVLTLLDFSKAFDSVDHDLLLQKLQNQFNFDISICKLLSSYLLNRHQFVMQGEDSSSMEHLSRGVPQGSVLGPLLFSMFINDLPSAVSNSYCHLFADDVQLHIRGPISNVQETILKLNEDLANVYSWSCSNRLKLNPDKSTYIIISRKKLIRSDMPNVVMNESILSRSEGVKNLGVWFDERLDWSLHVSKVCGKVFGLLRRVWHVAWALPQSTKQHIIRSLIFPHISYAIEVYYSLSSKLKNQLQMAFNACTRLILGLRKYDRLGDSYGLLLNCTLDKFVDKATCCMLFKIIRNRSPEYLYRRIAFARSNRTRMLKTPSRRLSSFDGMFFVRGIALWNRLPLALRLSTTLSEFKRTYTLWMNQH